MELQFKVQQLFYHIINKMHTNPGQFKDRELQSITQEVANELLRKARQFQKGFQRMQSQFSQSENDIYYIVSVNFISEWKDYCLSASLQRLSLRSMNQDIYENNQIKIGLVEKADFQVVNQQIYSLFDPFSDTTCLNRRQAIVVGKQKRVPIYLQSFRYLVTTFQLFKAMDLGKKQVTQLKVNQVRTSEQSTLNHLISTIRKKQLLPDSIKIRLWLPQEQLTLQKFYNLVKAQLKPCQINNYRIKGVGKRLEDLDAKISQLVLSQNTYFILQTKMDKEKERFVFVKDNQDRCQGCNLYGVLEFSCDCKKVKYCSQNCLEKDKHYHMRKCPYAEQMQLNRKVDMTISAKNIHGLVGLKNLGNTCFMNSCLQCLSHTSPLTQYFLKQFFQAEINKTNPIGTKGKLVKNYAKFIKAMWCDQDDIFSPYGIKNAVSDVNPIFSGYAQHDSQQFFSFLVDGLHEDLNRIEKKPYVESIQEENKSQTQLAKESWVAHLKRNQSIITETMSGQYRSIVTCPDCNHKSTTFDPFITVSLPIPQSVQAVNSFFLIHGNMEKKNKMAWFKYSKKSAQQWNRKACEEVGADPSRCCLYLVTLKQNIYRVGRESMSEIVHKIQNQSKNLFLVELNDEQLAVPKQNAIQFTMRMSQSTYHSSEQLFFKIPMIFDRTKMDGLIVYKRFLRIFYGQAYDQSKNRRTFGWGGKSYEDYEKEMLRLRPFKVILRLGKKIERSYHRVQIQFRKQVQVNDQDGIIELLQNQSLGNSECQLDARFQRRRNSSFNFERLKDFDTVGRQPKADEKYEQQIQLDKCLQSFSSLQTLQTGNEWFCPKCKQHKLANKQLSIYRAPKVLILHLKRFKQKAGYKKYKNETLVRFPHELDLKPYLINYNPMEAYKLQIQNSVFIPSKAQGLPLINFSTKSQPTYSLYAVSNHFGGLGGGHYTAYAKDNDQWYNFDDSHLTKVSKKDIIRQSAYLLFYERKQ